MWCKPSCITTSGPTGPLQLTITGSAILDAEGRGIDGNKDGQSGGNYATTLG